MRLDCFKDDQQFQILQFGHDLLDLGLGAMDFTVVKRCIVRK